MNVGLPWTPDLSSIRRLHLGIASLAVPVASMIKTLSLLILLPLSFGMPQVNGQTLPPAADTHAEEPLQMIVDYGQGNLKRRVTHGGVMEPIGVPANQQVAITLQFLRKRAGRAVTIGRLDGGEIDLQGPATISADGSVLFHFQAGAAPGVYRLLVQGPEQYQISLYAVDPNRPTRAPNPGGH